VPAPEADPPLDYCGERTAMMPQRRRTRAQTAPRASPSNVGSVSFVGPAPPETDPPPF
jgi:hypothetical protein